MTNPNESDAFFLLRLSLSLRVRKRFPTMEHVLKAGLITEPEVKLMEKPNAGYTGNKWWMPLVWATKIVDMVRRMTCYMLDKNYSQS